jgi:hypothetical protein
VVAVSFSRIGAAAVAVALEVHTGTMIPQRGPVPHGSTRAATSARTCGRRPWSRSSRPSTASIPPHDPRRTQAILPGPQRSPAGTAPPARPALMIEGTGRHITSAAPPPAHTRGHRSSPRPLPGLPRTRPAREEDREALLLRRSGTGRNQPAHRRIADAPLKAVTSGSDEVALLPGRPDPLSGAPLSGTNGSGLPAWFAVWWRDNGRSRAGDRRES